MKHNPKTQYVSTLHSEELKILIDNLKILQSLS